MSYKVDDYVVHESSGVCKIISISDMELMGKGSMKTYYTMVPVYKNTAQVFVPLEGAQIRLRDVSSRDEIEGLFDRIADIDVIAEGKFVQELLDPKKHWVGSSNQRVLDVKDSLEKNEVVLHQS